MLTLLAPLSLFIYLLLGWHFCQTRLAGKRALPEKASRLLLAIGIICHGIAITHGALQANPNFGAAEALSLTAWLAIMIYCVGQLKLKLDGLEPPLFAFAASFVALSLILPAGHAITYSQNSLSRAHFLLAMLAQSFLFVAAGIAILMRLTDNTLHHHAGKLLARTLPPLLTLERLLFSAIGVGFLLLTLALTAGSILNWQQHGQLAQLSHKTIFALSSWLLFASLLLGHKIKGWRGRFAANWTLTAFSILFLGYIGSRIVLEAILGKA
ncbi:cytochrome c biogenesis protein CcsA [Chitinibacter bivalviorum]|uniref:Cytochrome c biogenesis protein CcsA n=1 Tax=Chitinibacter bivalviorum TaxID=2739434 RepID=A0A7H9BJ45_9NEIS|nr:cytochrome c biogenesis protein CcsA [Chitinibacter bivalviorum]QLG88675.1 cytochrome c biogenesis protein CcsA [Chitinibacter bivalviorum]